MRRPGILFLSALLSLGIGAGFPAGASAKSARRHAPGLAGLLKYQTGIPNPTIHRELSIAQIERLSGFKASAAWQNPGLTVGEHELRTDFQLGGIQSPGNGRVRVYLESLQVTFRYTALDVYVADDYAEGSCEARQILLHEMQHVAVHRRVYARYQAELKRRILGLGLPTKARMASYPSLHAAQEDLSRRLRALTRGLYDQFKRDLSRGNDRLDTKANYRAIQKRCKDWK